MLYVAKCETCIIDKYHDGKTAMSERFDDHHKADCFKLFNANCLSIHAESNSQNRLRIEADLV